MRSPALKRVLDVSVATLALLILSPVIAFLYVLIRFRLGAPVFFLQQRPGLDGKLFTLIKFRTMKDGRNSLGNLLPDSERITRFGKFLRSCSLDELPELWNVLRGDMSLVGPRPLLPEYLPRYSAEQRRRHEVRPGITGWAQIKGRNALSWPDRFRLDVWYVDHWTIWLDVKILLLTVFTVLKREGVSAPGHETMPAFEG